MILPPQLFVGSEPTPAGIRPPRTIRERAWKPAGGIWTSSYSAGSSDWVRWCEGESFRVEALTERWLLQPVDARVYAVDDKSSVIRLFDDYGVSIFRDHAADMGSGFVNRPQFQTVDWERFVEDYDALWLLSPWIDFGGMPLRLASMMFYGWDCESTWWARWAFEDDPAPVSV